VIDANLIFILRLNQLICQKTVFLSIVYSNSPHILGIASAVKTVYQTYIFFKNKQYLL